MFKVDMKVCSAADRQQVGALTVRVQYATTNEGRITAMDTKAVLNNGYSHDCGLFFAGGFCTGA